MKLVLTHFYERQARSFFKRHPDLVREYEQILNLLISNHTHPSLGLHKLKGNLKNFWGISLTYKFRIILILKINDEEIDLIDIGSHDDIY